MCNSSYVNLRSPVLHSNRCYCRRYYYRLTKMAWELSLVVTTYRRRRTHPCRWCRRNHSWKKDHVRLYGDKWKQTSVAYEGVVQQEWPLRMRLLTCTAVLFLINREVGSSCRCFWLGLHDAGAERISCCPCQRLQASRRDN